MECNKFIEFFIKRYAILSSNCVVSIKFKDLIVAYRECSKDWLKFYKQNKPADSNQLKLEKVGILTTKSLVKTCFQLYMPCGQKSHITKRQ